MYIVRGKKHRESQTVGVAAQEDVTSTAGRCTSILEKLLVYCLAGKWLSASLIHRRQQTNGECRRRAADDEAEPVQHASCPQGRVSQHRVDSEALIMIIVAEDSRGRVAANHFVPAMAIQSLRLDAGPSHDAPITRNRYGELQGLHGLSAPPCGTPADAPQTPLLRGWQPAPRPRVMAAGRDEGGSK